MSEAEIMTKVRYNNPDVTIRPIAAGDEAAVTAFANAMPPHDLIFLSRDIRNDKVVKAWLNAIDRGTVDSLLAIADGKVIATTAIMRDKHSWSPHVADLRVIIAPEWRGKGLGTGRKRRRGRYGEGCDQDCGTDDARSARGDYAV